MDADHADHADHAGDTGDVSVIADFRSKETGGIGDAVLILAAMMTSPDVLAAGPLPGVAEIVERAASAAGRPSERGS